MDLSFDGFKCPHCGAPDMENTGPEPGNGEITAVVMQCGECKVRVAIMPIREDLQYQISAVGIGIPESTIQIKPI